MSAPDPRLFLDRLGDMLVEDILAMSEGELRAELVEGGQDPEIVAAEMREMIGRAIEKAAARRAAAQAGEAP